MDQGSTSFTTEIKKIVGEEYTIIDEKSLNDEVKNTLGIHRSIVGIIQPISVSEIQQIVNLAKRHKISLSPISKGKNIGYGEKAPVTDGLCLIDLGRMNQIRDYDPIVGEVTVEPGVTQQQLYEFLKNQGGKYLADVTGAPPSASILGNTLEGGFGHTPLGRHRKHIENVDVVLGTGEFFSTGDFPSLGPNIAGAFIQSNFGIVTSLRIPLFPAPKDISTYTIQFKDTEHFKNTLKKLRVLRQNGIIEGLLHIGNATRLFMSTNRFPADLPKDKVIDDEEAMQRLSNSLNKTGTWTAVGALFGSKKDINNNKKLLKKELKGFARIQFFSNRKFRFLTWIVQITLPSKSHTRIQLLKGLKSLQELQKLTMGIPSEEPYKNILWRSNSYEDLGLIWYSPVIKANADEVQKLLDVSTPIFKKYRYEMPLTLTMVDHKHLIGVMNINFNKNNKEEISRAHEAYKELSQSLHDNGILPYRTGVLGIGEHEIPRERKHALLLLKKAWDPHNIIAPGRYGLDVKELER